MRNHHERYDGSGYPDKLGTDQLHTVVRITTIADSYDAMTSARPYRDAMSKDKAIKELQKGAGSQFDPQLVDVFLDTIPNTNRTN